MKKRVLTLFLILCLCASIIPVTSVTAAAANSTAKVYQWKQTDKQWKKIYDADWSKGCAVTALAVQIARSGLVRVDTAATSFSKKTREGFNPGTFAKAMKLKNNLSVSWDVSKTVSGFTVVKDSHFGKKTSSAGWNYYPATSKQEIIDAMKYYLDKGYFPIIEGPGSSFSSNKGSRHYVAVVEVTDNDVLVVDPASGKKMSLFSVKINGNKWSVKNIEKCGNPKGYGCCRLYKASKSKILA